MTHLRSLLIALVLAACVFPAAAFAQTPIDNRLKAMAASDRVDKAFGSAAIIVLGRTVNPNEIYPWLVLMGTPEYGMSDEIANEVDLNGAVKFLKAFIAKPAGAGLRAELIDRAFLEVHGRNSTPLEQASWDAEVKAGKAYYASIVVKESAKLNASPALRKEMIQRAYLFAEGRLPYPGDLAFWGGKQEHYREIVEAERKWLYSPGGAKELVEVAKRAWKAAYGTVPSDEALKAVLVRATQGKMVYAELAKAL
ncbi:hypothetical protein OF829_03545 [Sphingomonas sp. LB-2]|uniref:hypothetical protein n=1 Tax=Sphingomonas caeni TaxID=2984949 RepID=UPI0022307715|nr:hypothetical protein [Sphingomonas caeni]MCW3846300.1 hypothetical protein [Sphingomonas caeni]